MNSKKFLLLSLAVGLLLLVIFGDRLKAEYHYQQGSASYKAGEYEQAIASYTEAIKLKPDFAKAYNQRGNAYFEIDKFDHAIADYGKALEINPDLAQACLSRGNAYYEAGDLALAIQDYERYVGLAPTALNRFMVIEAIEELKSELVP